MSVRKISSLVMYNKIKDEILRTEVELIVSTTLVVDVTHERSARRAFISSSRDDHVHSNTL